MARVDLAPGLVGDFNRNLAFQRQNSLVDAPSRIAEIMHAIDVLSHNPLIGRPVANGMRELVIGRKSHGYVALYRYVDEFDRSWCSPCAVNEKPAMRAQAASSHYEGVAIVARTLRTAAGIGTG